MTDREKKKALAKHRHDDLLNRFRMMLRFMTIILIMNYAMIHLLAILLKEYIE